MMISKDLRTPPIKTSYSRIGNLEGIELYFLKRMIEIDGVGSGRCDLCIGVRNNGNLILRKPTTEENLKITNYIKEKRMY